MSTVLKPPSPASMQKLGHIANGHIAASALNVVARLSVAEQLVDGPDSVENIAKKVGANADALCRVLRLLCSMGVFEETSEKTFANNEASDCLRADVPFSQRDMVIFIADSFHFQTYADIMPTLRDGKTMPEHMFNKNVFQYWEADKDGQARFDNAMTNFSRNGAKVIVQNYDFSSIGTLVDVAGGHGYLLATILEKNPNMKGILFDLPHVVGGAKPLLDEKGLSSRCELVGGDFFKSVPTGDAIIMKHIIHDWDDDKAVQILKVCHAALKERPAGKLIIAELIVGGRNEAHPSKFMDVEMLVLPGGRERTEQEYAVLFQKAGFKLQEVVPIKESPYGLYIGVIA